MGEHPMGTVRVVCYVNQFFGQLGGEEQAGVGPEVVTGAVGAARAVQQALGDAGTVVATVRCGDNYVAERPETAVAELMSLVAAQRPDLLVAGPAFQAGRYGVACGALCAAVQSQLGVPAVTGMHEENPGVDLYRRPVHIARTGGDTARMLDEVRRRGPRAQARAGRTGGRPAGEHFARSLTRHASPERPAAGRRHAAPSWRAITAVPLRLRRCPPPAARSPARPSRW
jgi:glycine reductase